MQNPAPPSHMQCAYGRRNPDAALAGQRPVKRKPMDVAKRHPSLLFSGMLKCAKTIERRLAGILAHWERRTTNAFMEALNSVFSAVKRKARGYRSTDNLITMLYFTGAKLRKTLV